MRSAAARTIHRRWGIQIAHPVGKHRSSGIEDAQKDRLKSTGMRLAYMTETVFGYEDDIGNDNGDGKDDDVRTSRNEIHLAHHMIHLPHRKETAEEAVATKTTNLCSMPGRSTNGGTTMTLPRCLSTNRTTMPPG